MTTAMIVSRLLSLSTQIGHLILRRRYIFHPIMLFGLALFFGSQSAYKPSLAKGESFGVNWWAQPGRLPLPLEIFLLLLVMTLTQKTIAQHKY